MKNDILHRTVLEEEAIRYLNVLSNHTYIDCTLGGGGHTEAILERNGPNGKVIAFELDAQTIKRTKKRLKRFGSRLIIIHDNFRSIEQVTDYGLRVTGILYDLGTSMDLLKNSGRGFSFLIDEPLDMRFSDVQTTKAEDIVNGWKEKDLGRAIYQYGEERWSRRIARVIVAEREKQKIRTTFQLTEAIGHAIPARYRHGRIHYATRTFQALRILVNDELGALEESLESAVTILEKGGRVVVISFHSLEDRIVKQFFKKMWIGGVGTILTKKPIVPSGEEIQENPASHSAKLRAFELCQ